MTLVGLQPLGDFTPLQLLYNNLAVVVGLVYVHLPFMVLPLYAALDRLDKSLIEASLDLGAGHLRTLFLIVVPLALPGIISGIIITFVPALGAYLTPDLLGGPDSQMIANVIERQFKQANDWPFGAALSFLLMYATFGAIALACLFQPRQVRGRSRDLAMAERRAPLEYNRMWQMRLWLFAVFFFLYAPLVALIAFSFNDSKRNTVWRGFTFKYYDKLFNDEDLLDRLRQLAHDRLDGHAYLARHRRAGRSPVCGATASPARWPWRALSRYRSWCRKSAWASPCSCSSHASCPGPTISSGRSISAPSSSRMYRSVSPSSPSSWARRLASFNKEQEEAARDLGANDWQAFRDVLLPHIRPALIAGGLLAFTLSLDDFVITFFTSGPDTITFPVKVYSMLRFSVTPEVNAASTMLIVLTIALMILMMVMQSRTQNKG